MTPDSLPLKGIHLPAPVGFWPPAPGWWLISAILLLLIAIAGIRGRRYWHKRRQWRRVEGVLSGILADSPSDTLFAARLSRLLKQAAMACHPHDQVAGLTGLAWLQFLDATGGNGAFQNGAGRSLLTAPYQASPALDRTALAGLAKHWLKRNLF